ncbi:sigma 54-interacting transcriptional regulator [Paraburkholderia sp. RP-4-7]|uniref:Sigma 54-interacting transcriptional regulator n=1 Tax=Paraburkholderia polaris TaxID=2728848 RepID=A0A848IBZ1_9BURK|nr:sigma 54-interacting transcriptional regulator [Paraburkholderia polaris]NML97594.1 sigma 54-interacting transcriptional regulator [Paraburkholderia polaris]
MSVVTQVPLQVALNLIPAHTWYADRSGALTFINERCADYLGLALDHPLRSGIEPGSTWDCHIEFLHPDDHEEARTAWSRCNKSGSADEVTFRVRSAKGGYRWFLSRAEPRLAGDGTLLGWFGINLDIEEQKQSEFYLAEGQRLARAGSWAFTAAGFEYWSAGLFRIHGLEPGRKAPDIPQYLALVHPDDRDFVADVIQKMLADRCAFDFKKRIVRPDGVIRHIRCVATPMADRGDFERFVGIELDVTEHEELTGTLRKSEEEFRQIVDLAPQHVGVMGPKGERLYANRTSLDYLGVSLDEWLREPLGFFIHPDDRERLKAFQDLLSNSRSHELELRLLKRDGSYRWFLARYSPLRDDRGQLIRWYVACTDIDDRKRAEYTLQRENFALREEIDKASMFKEIVGDSPALKLVLSRVSKVAASDSTVLILGETGTGKELVARAVHRQSRRSSKAFVVVNCAAIPRDLVTSELFGHEKGAFTGATQRRLGRFELADGGTIFLDEVGELLPDIQVALLRVLQEREFERVGGREPIPVNARVIAATNRDLNKAVADGSFREDLFYRLNVFPVDMPPLRERREDIPLLAQYFIDRFSANAGKKFERVNEQTLQRLQSYPWPGNVRELQNVIERSVIVCGAEEFTIDDSWLSAVPAAKNRLALSSTIVAHEKTIIEEALRDCNGRVYGPSGAATRLGLPRSTLESKIRALRIDKRRFRQ